MLRFSCEDCGHRLKADEKFVGRTVKCPRCGHAMKIPARSQRARDERQVRQAENHQEADVQEEVKAEAEGPRIVQEAESPTDKPAASSSGGGAADAPVGHFSCPKCGKLLGLNAKIGGRWARCSACGKIADIPDELLQDEAEVDQPAEPVVTQKVSSRPEGGAKPGAEPGKAGAGAATEAAEAPEPVARAVRPRPTPEVARRFLPPHYEELPELPDYGLPDFHKGEEEGAEPEEDYAPPLLGGGYGFQLTLSPHKQPLLILVSILLLIYAVFNTIGGFTRIFSAFRLSEGETPAWTQPMTPEPPEYYGYRQQAARAQLEAADAQEQEGQSEAARAAAVTPLSAERRSPGFPGNWLIALGALFLLLAAANAVGGLALLTSRRDWVAGWVFWVAIVAIVLECLDLSITRTGHLTLSKPLWWLINVVAICGVVSR